MPRQAHLADGTVLEFPDGTSDAVMDRVVQSHVQASPRGPALTPQQQSSYDRLRNSPIRQGGQGPADATPQERAMIQRLQSEASSRDLRNIGHSIAELPRIDAGRTIHDLADQGSQAWNTFWQHPLENVGSALYNLPGAIVHSVTDNVQSGEAANDDMLRSVARNAYPEAVAAQQRSNSSYERAATNFAAPFAGPLARGPLSTMAMATGVTLPQSIDTSQPLQGQLPGALLNTGGAIALSGLLHAGISALPAVARSVLPTPAQARAADFEAAGVRPTLAALQGKDAAPVATAIAENPVGGNVRRNLQNSVDDTQAAAQRITQSYGTPLNRELAGENVQGAIDRWATDETQPPQGADFPDSYSTPTRAWSFAAKANSLYEHVMGAIQRSEDSQVAGATAQPRIGNTPPLTTVQNTSSVMDSILGRVRNPAIAATTTDRQIAQFARAIQDNPDRIHFGDLRAFRTFIREVQSKPLLRRGVNDAGLERIEGALTQDIQQSATNIAGPQAAHALQRVDTFYRAGMQRINNALKPFAAAGTPASAYDRILTLASDTRSGANTSALMSLKRTLRPDEWRNVASTLVDRLGRTAPGAANALEPGAFSIDNFVKNYAQLSPRARRILFGSMGGGGAAADDLATQLDTLARVAGYQKGVRGFSNYSRSGQSLQTIGTLGAVGGASADLAMRGDVTPLAALIGGAAAARLTGEALTNPRFVRWLVGATQAQRSGRGILQSLPALARLAAHDPALVPAYNALRQQAASGDQSQPAPDANADPAGLQQPQPAGAMQ